MAGMKEESLRTDALLRRCRELEEENALLRKNAALLRERSDELHEANAELLRSGASMLERSEDQRRALTELLENSDQIAVLKDTALRYLGVNRAYLELTGRTGDEDILGRTDAELFRGLATESEIEQYMENDRRALSLPRGQSLVVEETLPGEDGRPRTFLTRKFPVYCKDGSRLLGVGTLTSEITDRKRAEEAMRRNERYLRAVLQTTVDGFWVIDCATRRIVDVNDAYCAMTGFSREELLSFHINDLDTVEDTAGTKEHAERVMRNGSEIFETRHRRKDGGTFDVEISVTFLDIDGGRFVCFCRDITERKKAEERLRIASRTEQRLRTEAQAASRAKSQFLANTSHELRTPLNGILGYTDLLRDTPLDETQRAYLDNVRRSAGSLLEIVDAVLDFSGISSGNLRLEPVPSDAVRIATAAADAVRPHAEKKALSLRLRTAENLPPQIVVDPARLRQVLVNLLGNAVKFTHEGFVELAVERSSGERGERLVFSVRDSGIGIREEDRDKLFLPFSQADSSNTRQYGGAGLGLAIADGILKRMGSALEVESVPGEGSRFFFTLASGGEEAHAGVEPGTPSSGDAPLKVLVVEDVKLNRSLVRALVLKLLPGAEIYEAEDGQRGVELFREHAPDIVFMDLQMPVKDGFDATLEIRSMERGDARRALVVALTANATPEARETAFRCGMDDYIVKPLDRHMLRRILERFPRR